MGKTAGKCQLVPRAFRSKKFWFSEGLGRDCFWPNILRSCPCQYFYNWAKDSFNNNIFRRNLKYIFTLVSYKRPEYRNRKWRSWQVSAVFRSLPLPTVFTVFRLHLSIRILKKIDLVYGRLLYFFNLITQLPWASSKGLQWYRWSWTFE